MKLDEIVLVLKSSIGSMKNDISSTVSELKKLTSTTSTVTQTMDKVSKTIEPVASNLNKATSGVNTFNKAISEAPKQSYIQLESELKRVKKQYNDLNGILKMYENSLVGQSPESMEKIKTSRLISTDWDTGKTTVWADSFTDAEQKLELLSQRMNQLRGQITALQSEGANAAQPLKNSTDQASNSAKKAADSSNSFSQSMKNLKNNVSKVSSTIGKVKNVFGSISKYFDVFNKSASKGFDSLYFKLKKFGLGLLGVRTAMSFLTKAVHAYMSFDSELQDSIQNSYNMLGSLLAPAIIYVANAFATAINYIYQFVTALTGIDLVAKANARALQTQAKAAKGAAAAQRGLLAMDEITNLPTEPSGGGGSPAAQIEIAKVKPNEFLNTLMDALKKHKWHRAGEIIAEGINRGLKKINWEKVRERAERTGYNIADFLNGVFELDWRLLGRSIANAINTAIDFVYGFVTKLEWGRIGAGIGDSITSFFETFDFNKLADSINNTLTGILNMFSAAFAHMDPELMGNKISEFLLRIKWEDIARLLVKVLLTWVEISLRTQFYIISSTLNSLFKDYTEKLKTKFEQSGKTLGQKLGNALVWGLKYPLNNAIRMINMTLNPIGTVLGALYKFAGKNPPSISSFKIPYLATGTNEIMSEGLYHLHEGEAVVPKKYNPAVDGYNGGADNRQIIDLLIDLNASMIQYAERPININMNSRKVAEATYDDIQMIHNNKNVSNVMTRS